MSSAVSEHSILQALRQVPPERWAEVLRYLNSLRIDPANGVDAANVERLAQTTWTAVALQQWPPTVQDAILREQAARLIAQAERDPTFSAGVAWWTPAEIHRLPVAQRDILVEASATVAARMYEEDPDLTAFDAYGEDDLYGDSAKGEPKPNGPSATETR
jgi:hypothetical protein